MWLPPFGGDRARESVLASVRFYICGPARSRSFSRAVAQPLEKVGAEILLPCRLFDRRPVLVGEPVPLCPFLDRGPMLAIGRPSDRTVDVRPAVFGIEKRKEHSPHLVELGRAAAVLFAQPKHWQL